MDANSEKVAQQRVFQEIIEEFKKSEPSDQRIKQCMANLDLEYQEDAFANMQSVLNALSFRPSSLDFKESK